jgi:hypothetical protein
MLKIRSPFVLIEAMPPTYKRKAKDQESERFSAVADPENNLPKLTLKQERFAKHVLNGKSAKEAYRLSFDCSNSSEITIGVNASKLIHSTKIALYIRSRQRIGLEVAAINQATHLAELGRLRELAVENQQISAGVQAEHYRGRVAGLYNDKLSLQVGPSDAMLLSQLATMLGPDLAQALGKQLGIEEDSPFVPAEDELLSLPPPLESDDESKG